MSYVLDAGSANKLVAVRIVDEPLAVAIGSITQSAGVDVSWRGDDMVYVGELDETDRSILVRRVRRGSQAEITAALRPLLSTGAQLTVTDDGLVVLSERAMNIERVNNVIEQIESSQVPVWIVEVYLCQMRRQLEQALSIEGQPFAAVALDLASLTTGGLTTNSKGANATVGLDLLLRAIDEDTGSDVVLRPVLVLADGANGSVSLKTSRPVQRSITTEAGAVVSDGFQLLEAGSSLHVQLREHGVDAARLEIDVDVTEFDNAAGSTLPAVSGTEIDTSLICQSGGVYLISGATQRRESIARQTGLRLGSRSGSEDVTVNVFVRATRIAGARREQRTARQEDRSAVGELPNLDAGV